MSITHSYYVITSAQVIERCYARLHYELRFSMKSYVLYTTVHPSVPRRIIRSMYLPYLSHACHVHNTTDFIFHGILFILSSDVAIQRAMKRNKLAPEITQG